MHSPIEQFLAGSRSAPDPVSAVESRALAAVRNAMRFPRAPPGRVEALRAALPDRVESLAEAFEAFFGAGLVPESYVDGSFPGLRPAGPAGVSTPGIDAYDRARGANDAAVALAADPEALLCASEIAREAYRAAAWLLCRQSRLAAGVDPLAVHPPPRVNFFALARSTAMSYSGYFNGETLPMSGFADALVAYASPADRSWRPGTDGGDIAEEVSARVARPAVVWARMAARGGAPPWGGGPGWAEAPNYYAALADVLAVGCAVSSMRMKTGDVSVLVPSLRPWEPVDW